MLNRNGVQLGTQNSIAGRKFFEAVFRLSQIGPGRRCHSSLASTKLKFTRSSLSRTDSQSTQHERSSHATRIFPSAPRSTQPSITGPDSNITKEQLGKAKGLIKKEKVEPWKSSIQYPAVKDAVGATKKLAVKELVRDTSELENQQSTPLTKEVRDIMRNVPQSVVALTTAFPSRESTYSSNRARGMALSSLTTVSLDTMPIISFNIKTPSHTLEALKQSRHFLIHFLLGNQDGAKLANDLTHPYKKQTAFEGIGKSEYWKGLEIKPCPVMLTEKKRDRKHVILPQFYGSGLKGPILKCKMLKEGPGRENIGNGFVQVGDHVIVLARVVDVLKGRDDEVELAEHNPLAYGAGNYRVFEGANISTAQEKEGRADLLEMVESERVTNSVTPKEEGELEKLEKLKDSNLGKESNQPNHRDQRDEANSQFAIYSPRQTTKVRPTSNRQEDEFAGHPI